MGVSNYPPGGPDNVARGEIGVAAVTADQPGITTQVDITGLTLTRTLLTGRRYRTTIKTEVSSTNADGAFVVVIADGSNTQLARATGPATTASYSTSTFYEENGNGTSVVRKCRASKSSGTGSITISASASSPTYLTIDDIGPAV